MGKKKNMSNKSGNNKEEVGVKYSIEFEVVPKNIVVGSQWITLRLKNIGTEGIRNLDTRLNSLDSYSLGVYKKGKYLAELKLGKEKVMPFRVTVTATTKVFASIFGYKKDRYYYWEPPPISLKVGKEVEELKTLFAMTTPNAPLGKTIECETIIIDLERSEELNLEFWAQTPSGKFEELAKKETKALSAGEEATYSAKITPKEEGLCTIQVYLHNDYKRIGHETDSILVRKLDNNIQKLKRR
jgi:hypothetical protein